MSKSNQSDPVRAPHADAAAGQDPHDSAQHPRDAAVQRQIQADTEVHHQQAERLKATEAPAIDKRTVEQIAEDAEQRAKS